MFELFIQSAEQGSSSRGGHCGNTAQHGGYRESRSATFTKTMR